MATRVVTFLTAEGPPARQAQQFEFEGARGLVTRNHLGVLEARSEGPCTVLTLGTQGARALWASSGVFSEGWAADLPQIGFRELIPGGTDGERWASFTALATALADTPLTFELLGGGSVTESQAPRQIILDITHASREIPFLAASVASFLQYQRRRNNGAPLPLRVVQAPAAGESAMFAELTQLLHVFSWEAAAGAPRSNPGAVDSAPRERLSGWARRARTIPAVPWALAPTPLALNLTGRPLSAWSPAEHEAAQQLGLTPTDSPLMPPSLDAHAALSEVEAQADQLATRALDEQPTAVLLDAEPTLALALVARLQRAGVRCFARMRQGDAFAAWREFPSLGV